MPERRQHKLFKKAATNAAIQFRHPKTLSCMAVIWVDSLWTLVKLVSTLTDLALRNTDLRVSCGLWPIFEKGVPSSVRDDAVAHRRGHPFKGSVSLVEALA